MLCICIIWLLYKFSVLLCQINYFEFEFQATSSFVHNFKTICEFKLELQSGNAKFGSKSVIYLSPVILQFCRWPWKTIGHLFYAISSFVHHIKAIGELKLELQSGNTQFGAKWAIFCPVCEIWRPTLKNNRAHHSSPQPLMRQQWPKLRYFYSIMMKPN